jgi:hypothetical protein
MSRLRIVLAGIMLSLLWGKVLCLTARASQETEYAQAMQLYTAHRYKEAGEMFWKSITDGNLEARPWLLSGNCLYAQGRYAEAAERFKMTSSTFKNTPEAKAADEYRKKAETMLKAAAAAPTAGTVSAVAAPATAGAAAATTAVTASANATAPGAKVYTASGVAKTPPARFKNRFEVVKSEMGHPPVSPLTKAMLDKAITKIPPNLMSVLDNSDATIHLTCSLVDRWPDCLTTKHSYDNQTMSNDRGHTYGHDIWVCERPVNATTNIAEDPFPAADIEATFFNEVGHAVDDLMGNFSKNPEFRDAYAVDMRAPLYLETNVVLFVQAGDSGPSETCAEIVSDLLGARGSQTVNMKLIFPRSYAWVQKRLHL